MIFDTHLINVALAGLGISAGVAILIAVAIIGIVAWHRREGLPAGRTLTAVPAQAQAQAPAARTASEREPRAA